MWQKMSVKLAANWLRHILKLRRNLLFIREISMIKYQRESTFYTGRFCVVLVWSKQCKLSSNEQETTVCKIVLAFSYSCFYAEARRSTVYLKLYPERRPSFWAFSIATLIAPPTAGNDARYPMRTVLLAGSDESTWLICRPSTSDRNHSHQRPRPIVAD